MKKKFLYSFVILYCAIFLAILQGCQKNKSEETVVTNEKTEKLTHESSLTSFSSDCKNCGMPSKEYPKWHVKMLQNSSESYFCSPRCMFIQATEGAAIKVTDSIFVVDYYNQKFFDARQAYFVINSDVTGPMGHDFVPFADEKAAKEFQTEHKGKEIVRFSEVTEAMILKLGK